MKKLIYSLLFASALVFTGCDGFLEENSRSNYTTDQYYGTKEGYASLINSCYAKLRNIYGDYPDLFLSGTDLYMETSARTSDDNKLATYASLDPNNATVFTFYRRCFEAIGCANTALYYSTRTDESNPMVAQYAAEARFLRAFYYFHLVQQFGGVPIVREMTTSPILSFPRDSEADVYGFIITELEDLLGSALLAKSEGENYGRVDKRTVNFFLAKAYLTRGYQSYGETTDFTKAKTYADAAIGDATLSNLVSTFAASYKATGAGYRNSDVIWSVLYSQASMPNPQSGNVQQALFGTHLGSVFGHKITDKRFTISSYGHWLFTKDIDNPRNDTRYNETFMMYVYDTYFTIYTKSAAELTNTKIAYYYPAWWQATDTVGWRAANLAQRAGTVIWCTLDPGDPETNLAAFQQKSYEYAQHFSLSFEFPTVRKFDSPDAPTLDKKASIRDVDIARMADAYLTAAEACVKSGNAAAAVPYINAVRKRGIATTDSKREIVASQATIEFILDERARELLGHYDRWYDLKRTGTLIDHAVKYNPDLNNDPNKFKGFGGVNKLLRPIPQSAIDQNKAKIVQNPGYGS